MNKKQTIKKTAALLLGMAIAMGTTSCAFITKDSQADLNQTVAKVNIHNVLKEEEEYSSIAGDFANFKFSGEVKKRELISYYVSVGYQYVENYGYSYEDTFNMLLNALVNREILGQQAAAYFLNEPGSSLTAEGYETFKANALTSEKNPTIAKLLEKYEDVLKYKYFLTKGGTDSKEYDIAVYTLKKNINNSIDSLEASYIAEEEDHDHEETRTLPTGVDTKIEDYHVSEADGYDVYTGRNAAGPIVGYDKVEGSTVASRQKAYNAFLSNLQEYNLVSTTGKVEDTSKVTTLEYYYVELASLLEQRLISNYQKKLEEKINKTVNEEEGAYVVAKYNEMFEEQKRTYENAPSAFAKQMDSASENTFLLYAPYNTYVDGNETKPLTFGYVYNILIPFSTAQEDLYEAAKGVGTLESDLYQVRRDIAERIEGKDLRTSWISAHEHANYSSVDKDYVAGSPVYFFEDNNGTKNEKLTHYTGKYPFKGEVNTNVDEGEEYEITAHSITIDGFIKAMEAYIAETAGVTTTTISSAKNADETKNTGHAYWSNDYKNAEDEIDYSKFIYYTGKVNFTKTQKAAGFFQNDEEKITQQYEALSAVNELMFAYSTDTGCLNTYMGYSVSPYGTNFVKEFEYAAQQVVEAGVGNYAVCLTDYGWHIIYCSFSYNADYMADSATGDVYGGYVHADAVGDAKVEGSFSHLFYEYVKESAYANYTSEVQNRTLKKYNNKTCVSRYEKKYKDLYNFNA